MKSRLSVNEVLELLTEVDGLPLEIEGILQSHTEGFEIVHYPKRERCDGPTDGENKYQPGIWLGFGVGSLQPNINALNRWVGKRVRIHGIARSYTSLTPFGALGRGGFGPWGFWPIEIEPYSLQRITAEERRENAG